MFPCPFPLIARGLDSFSILMLLLLLLLLLVSLLLLKLRAFFELDVEALLYSARVSTLEIFDRLLIFFGLKRNSYSSCSFLTVNVVSRFSFSLGAVSVVSRSLSLLK